MRSKLALAALALVAPAAVACFTGDGSEPRASSDPQTTLAAPGSESIPPASDRPGSRFLSIDSLQALGEEEYAEGQIDTARSLFESALDEARQVGDSAGIARSLTWLAQAAWRLGDYDDTRRLGEEALAMKLRQRMEEDLFRSYNVLGLLAWNESRLLDAEELFSKAAEVARATGDSANLAKVGNNLALVQTSLGEFGEARTGFVTARATARDLGDPLIEGRVLINLAMLATEVGDPRAAINHLQEARPLLRAADDPIGEQSALGHLGVAYATVGESGRGVATLDSALYQARAHGLKQEEASNLEQLAQLHREAGNLARALELFDEARRINAELGLKDELATDLIYEAQIRARLGNPELALKDAREALRTHREIGSPLRELEDLVVLAELSHSAGLREESRAFLVAAEELADRVAVRTARIPVALSRARIADREQDGQEVLRALASAETDLEKGGYDVEWEAHALRARAYARTGALDSAVSEGRLAIAAIENVRGTFASGVLRDSYLRERAATYADQVTVLLEMGRVEEAFETADAARGRALLESIASGGSALHAAGSGTVRSLARGDELLRRIEELNRTLAELDELGLDRESEEQKLQAERLQAELQRLRSEYSATLIRAREHDPVGMALLGARTPGAAEVTSALRPGEALLEYLVLPDRLLLFALASDGVRFFASETPRDRVAGRVRVARGVLGQPQDGPGTSLVALERLWEELVGPALEAGALSGVERLIIVPHAELTYLPFSALRDPSSGRYLAEEFAITHLPTAAALPVLRRPTPADPAVRLGHASAFAPFPGLLPGTSLEIDAVGEALEDARLYRGREATEGRFRTALGSAHLVHAATHGVMNARNPMFSRIELAPEAGHRVGGEPTSFPATDRDGRLEVHELFGSLINASLVFLSGCETAMGAGWATAFGRGEEYSTLAQAFLHAGADNVIATLWRIDDPGAGAFAERFYSELRDTRSPAEALARTQRSMIADGEYAQPFYWAAYRLSGSGEMPAYPQGSERVSVRE